MFLCVIFIYKKIKTKSNIEHNWKILRNIMSHMALNTTTNFDFFEKSFVPFNRWINTGNMFPINELLFWNHWNFRQFFIQRGRNQKSILITTPAYFRCEIRLKPGTGSPREHDEPGRALGNRGIIEFSLLAGRRNIMHTDRALLPSRRGAANPLESPRRYCAVVVNVHHIMRAASIFHDRLRLCNANDFAPLSVLSTHPQSILARKEASLSSLIFIKFSNKYLDSVIS